MRSTARSAPAIALIFEKTNPPLPRSAYTYRRYRPRRARVPRPRRRISARFRPERPTVHRGVPLPIRRLPICQSEVCRILIFDSSRERRNFGKFHEKALRNALLLLFKKAIMDLPASDGRVLILFHYTTFLLRMQGNLKETKKFFQINTRGKDMSFCSFSKEFNENSYTAVENQFFTKYMPDADGFAVKVYLYGLYLCQERRFRFQYLLHGGSSQNP